MESIGNPSRSVRAQSGARLLRFGSTRLTFKLNEDIVVMKVRPGRDCNLANEQAIFAILKCHPPSPYIIRSSYHTEKTIFMKYATTGDLAPLLGEE